MRNLTGSVSGQYWPGQAWSGAGGSSIPDEYLPRGKARMHFPMRASARHDMDLRRRSRMVAHLLGGPPALAPEAETSSSMLPAPAPEERASAA